MALICDTLRSASMNYDDPMQVEEVLTKRIEQNYAEAQHSSHTLQTMADALPALGIVAAVLGVIKTMASIDQPPEILGKMIGGALVGTFLGVFLAYGIVGPFASRVRDVDPRGPAILQPDPRSDGRGPAQPRAQHLRRGRPPEHAARGSSLLQRAGKRAARLQAEPGGMIRRALIAGTALVCAATAHAQEGGAIRSGEHADFSRLVMRVDVTTEWSLETRDGRATVFFPGQTFDFGDRRRVRSDPAHARDRRAR